MVDVYGHHTAHGNPLDGAKRALKNAGRKDPGLPRPVPGGGEIVARGSKLYAVLPTVDGGSVTLSVTPAAEWRYHIETGKPRLNGGGNGRGNSHHSTGNGNGNGAEAVATLSPSERVKDHLDAALNILAAIEKRAVYLANHDTSIVA